MKFLLDTVLVIIADIDAAPVQLSSLVILKALGTADTFIDQISKHYIATGKRQILGLAGSIAILGNPTGLVKNLGSGFHSFFTEPAKGIRKGPKAFAKGLSLFTLLPLSFRSSFALPSHLFSVSFHSSSALVSLLFRSILQ